MPPRFIRRAVLPFVVMGIGASTGRAAAQEIVSGREAAAGAAALAGALLLDRAFDGAVRDGGGGSLEPLSDALNYGGRPQYAVALLAGTWAAGTLAGRGEAADAALHVAAALAAGGVVNGALKYSVGRERPSETDDPHRFRPFADRNRWQSFPSGHAVVAFSLAAAVSEEARTPWVDGAGVRRRGGRGVEPRLRGQALDERRHGGRAHRHPGRARDRAPAAPGG